jgi:hypothetical protein
MAVVKSTKRKLKNDKAIKNYINGGNYDYNNQKNRDTLLPHLQYIG